MNMKYTSILIGVKVHWPHIPSVYIIAIPPPYLDRHDRDRMVIGFVTTVKPVLCDLSREHRNRVT